MKSKLNYNTSTSFYPRLMISQDEKHVTFFIKENVGVILWSVEPEKIGYFAQSFGMDFYKDFKNSIELSND